jgi:hypothetical protein
MIASPTVQLLIDFVNDTRELLFPPPLNYEPSVVEQARPRCSLDTILCDGIAAVFLFLDL